MERVDPQSLQSVVVKLAREKGFLETLFNTIQEGVLVIDAEGRISYLNVAASQLLGLDPERSIGEPVTQFMSVYLHSSFFLLLVSCAFWTIVGVSCFKVMENWSRSKGTLGAY